MWIQISILMYKYNSRQFNSTEFRPLQVAGSVSLTWVQPRVLDATQVTIFIIFHELECWWPNNLPMTKFLFHTFT